MSIKLNGVDYASDNLTQPTDRNFRDYWSEPDSDNVIHVDWQKAREGFRKTAFLPKSLFLRGLVGAGILPQDQAIEAAKGNWPSTFSSVLSSLSEAAQFEAQINWAAATVVKRNDPLLEMLRENANVKQETLDSMFGYSGQ